MIDELALAARVPYELFVTVLQYAFLAFVVCCVIILFGVAIKYVLYVFDKIYLWWDTFVDIQQNRANKFGRVDILWGEYQYQLKQKDDAREEEARIKRNQERNDG